MAQQRPNPATGFLIMGAFNLLAAIVFIVFYLAHTSSGGERSYFLLIIGGVLALASGACFALYPMFRRRLEALRGR